MTPHDWSIAASVLGFLGSACLIYPGWRASRNLKVLESVRRLVNDKPPAATAPATKEAATEPAAGKAGTQHEAVDGQEVGKQLLPVMESQSAQWNRLDHGLLIGGIVLVVLSFATDLFLVKLATPS